MTYQELIKKGFKLVAFSYPDRVIIIKMTSVKEEDFENTTYTHMLSDNIPAFKCNKDAPILKV